MTTPRLFLSLCAGLILAAPSVAGDPPTLEQRLEQLASSLESARLEAHVPGMSIAIVKDDELVWARGFGLADVESELPADEQTIYAIGSTTKAFTATLIGMLADDGKASWDDPVVQHLPYFDLQVRSEDEDAQCTLRDLLSHRHGFVRMPILWFGNELSREEVLQTAAGAEPLDEFRAGFHYSNVMFLAAGEAAGAAALSSWDELMVERLFEPLGMTSSSITLAGLAEQPGAALGYRWDDEEELLEREELIDLDVVAPAGAVNSNVLDMARWLRFLLGHGELEGTQLISRERLLETWEPQIEMAPGLSYGMGWMLREHDGRLIVEHGGNIDGFSAEVALIPEEQLGFVLLLNQSASPLREASIALVFDALLEEWPEDDGGVESSMVEASAIDFEDFTGTYIANFATFRDERFEVLVQGDRLALDVPSQQVFEFQLPDAAGKWSFVLTDQIAVTFQRGADGAVTGLSMHQGGFQFEVPREGFEPEPEVPLETLEKYVGTFVRAEGGKRIKFFIARGQLTMEDKGKLLALNAPDAEGHASLRARADWGATFQTDAEGQVESLVFHGASGDKLFNKLAEAPESELPTLEEVLALHATNASAAAGKAVKSFRITGEVWAPQAGVRGALTIFSQGSDRYANHMDFGRFGRIDTAARGDEAWCYDSMRGFQALKGERLSQALLEHPEAIDGDWTSCFDSIQVVGTDTVGDRPVYVLRLRSGELPSRTYRVDAESGDVLRVNQISKEHSVSIPVTITRSDFVEIDGLRRPRRVEIENPMSGKLILTVEEIEEGLELGEEVFTLEDPGAGEGRDG